jgi:glycosyltransferase involved in cell wall biosynthesis
LAGAIRFLPFVPDVAPILKGLDVVVMPSLWEACGMLAMEAMVAGVPVIGTSCVGLREVLSGTPSVVVPPRDGAGLAAALLAEMERPTADSAKAFASEAARRFDVKEKALMLEKLMLQFL